MTAPELRLVEAGPLPYLLSAPGAAEGPGRPRCASCTGTTRGCPSRHAAPAFAHTLPPGLPPDDGPGDWVLEDHVGTARSACRDEREYRWLLSHRLPTPTEPSPADV